MPPLSHQDEQLLGILRSVVPDIVSYLDDAGYFDLGPDVGPLDVLEREGFWPRVIRKLRGKNALLWEHVWKEGEVGMGYLGGAGEVATQLGVDWQLPFEEANQYFKDHGMVFVRQVTASDKTLLRRAIEANPGMNERPFERMLRGQYMCSPARVRLIKRTETHTASNTAGFYQAERADARWKVWRATGGSMGDGRTRLSHREMHGEIAPRDRPYSNGLMFPCEPNCRCHSNYYFDKDIGAVAKRAGIKLTDISAASSRIASKLSPVVVNPPTAFSSA